MSFSYENQETNTYLVYKIELEDKLDTMGLGMLTNNKIPGLASTIFIQMDTTKYIKYNVSAKISVNQFFNGSVNKKRLLGVFSGIVNAMLSAEEYMIDPRDIILDTDFIFTDVSTCETVMICLPIEGVKSGQRNLGAFFKNIMFSTSFDQTENCDHIAKIINYLNSAPTFSLLDFKNLLEEIKRNNGPDDNMAVQPRTVVLTPPNGFSQVVSQPVQQRNAVQSVASVQQTNGNFQKNSAVPNVPQKQAIPQQKKKNNIQQPSVATNPVVQNPANQNEQKNISMFNLLMHYNKENAALYKAQKSAKKAQKQQGKNSAANNIQNNNFTVPGQNPKPQNPSGTNFAVPGQQSPGPGTNFAIPGQAAPLSTANAQGRKAQQAVQQQNMAQPGMRVPNQGVPNQGMPQQNIRQQGMRVPNQGVPQQNMAQQSMGVPQQNMAQQSMGMPQQNMAQQSMAMQQNMTVPQGQVNFGETSVLGSATNGQTTVLSGLQPGAPVMRPYLIRQKNNERILIDKPVFRIGKEKSYVDYFISDNTAISRSHANIIMREKDYYIVDTNSTNHTYINGVMIGSNSEMKLTNGDKVRLANEEFEFRFF